MFELNSYTAEDYIIWSIIQEPEVYAKKALLVSPQLFKRHKKVFEELINLFRHRGAQAVTEKGTELLAHDENLFKDIHAIMQESLVPSPIEFEAAVKLRKEVMQEALMEKIYNEYFEKKSRREEVSIQDLIKQLQELDMAFKDDVKLSLKEKKEELLSMDDLQSITLPIFNIEAYPSDIVLISAKTKAGKTTVAMNILMDFVKNQEETMDNNGNWQKNKVIYFTYEITDKIMLAMFTGLHKGKHWKDVTKQEKEEFINTYGDYMDIEYGLTLEKLIDVVWIAHPKIFVVDYDQLVLTNGRFESEERRIAHIVRSLKDVTTQTGSICILLSQINDDGKVRYSREKEHASSIHIYLEKIETEGIKYEIKLNRWGKAGDTADLIVDWETRKVTR